MSKHHGFTVISRSERAFTLIELLIVITIVVILATMGFLSYNNAIKKAALAVVDADLVSIYKTIAIARINKQQSFGQITGNFCTECNSCRTSTNISQDINCRNDLYSSWSNITTEALPRDPWNNPYIFDENEFETGHHDCLKDSLRSVGPDHLWGTPDDIIRQIPPRVCPY